MGEENRYGDEDDTWGSVSAINVKLPPSLAPLLRSHQAPRQLSPPRPRHFLRRTDGTITPLIAVDEFLPFSISFGSHGF